MGPEYDFPGPVSRSASPVTRMPDYDWALNRTFLAVVRTGSFSAAARLLSQAAPTVRRQIEELEQVVGSALFSRSQVGVSTTPLADVLVRYAERVERAATDVTKAVERERFSGTVRIAADGILMVRVLPPVFASLRDALPGLRFELVPNRAALTGMRSADLAFTVARPTDDGLVASRLATLETGLYAAASWITKQTRPLSRDSLVTSSSLVGAPTDATLKNLLGESGEDLDPLMFAIATDDQVAIHAAVLGGVGVALLPTALADREEVLERLLPESSGSMDIWMTTHSDLRESPQVRAVLDAVRRSVRILASAPPITRSDAKAVAPRP